MGGWTINPEKANAAIKAFEESAPPAAGASASAVQSVYDNQTYAKWGLQNGPMLFKVNYESVLDTSRAELTRLQEQLNAYVAGVKAAVKDFQQTDGDAAAQTTMAAEQEKAPQNVPSTPPPTSATTTTSPTGTSTSGTSGPQGYGPTAAQ